MLRVVFVSLLLALLMGCVVPVPTACEGVVCTHGTCVARGGSPDCVCSAEDLSSGLVCEVQRDPQMVDPRPAGELTVGSPLSVAFTALAEARQFTVPLAPRRIHLFRCSAGCGMDLLAGELRLATVSPTANEARILLPPLSATSLELTVWKPATASDVTLTLSVEEVADPEGEGTSTAQVFSPPFTVNAGFQYQGDTDYFVAEVTAPGWYRFQVSPWTDPSILTVFDADGLPTNQFEPWLSPGRYPLIVRGGLGSYTLLGQLAAPDDHGNTAQTATAIGIDETVAGVINLQRDVDVFRFEAAAPRTYRLECEGGTEQSWCRTPVGVLATSDGPHFQTVQGAEGLQYQVTLRDLGVDDHGNDRGAATPVTAGPVRIHHQYDTDVDLLAIEVGDDQVLITDGLVIDTPAPTNFRAWAPDRFIWLRQAGTVYLRRGPNCLVCDANLELRGPDVAGNDLLNPTMVTFPIDITGELELANHDVDVYVFTLADPKEVTLRCEKPTPGQSPVQCSLSTRISLDPLHSIWSGKAPLTFQLSAGSYAVRVLGEDVNDTAHVDYRVSLQ